MKTEVLMTYITLMAVVSISAQQQMEKPHIFYLHIQSDIRYRFATTLVTSKVRNAAEVAQETVFQVNLPKEAFISNFSMQVICNERHVWQIDDKIYSGTVKEKEAAKKAYEKAKKKGQSAGHVAAKPRETNKFKINVNVAALSTITFNLTYQELLTRRLGVYEHQIYVDPGRIVDVLKIEVHIRESRQITTLRVPPIRNDILSNLDDTGVNALAVVDRPSETSAYVIYQAGKAAQQSASEQGVSGVFEVQYDIERNLDAGEVLVVNGYFVHFIAPQGLPAMPKDIIFVLDVSGSMSGNKIAQMKEAMGVILGDMQEGDRFNILKFSTSVIKWQISMAEVTRDTISDAKTFVRSMQAGGSTNMRAALLEAVNNMKVDPGRVPIIVFLTDGYPSYSSASELKTKVTTANSNRYPIFGLSFGAGADYDLLKGLSTLNNGIARKIYESSDVTLQMSGFYDEVATTILSEVKVKYLDNATDVDSVTTASFKNYFNGSEFIVAGKLKEDVTTLFLEVEAMGKNGPIFLQLDSPVTRSHTAPDIAGADDYAGITEKLWAYLTIKQLIAEMAEAPDSTVKALLKQKALELSLKYGFVTPLTSLVVIKPEIEKRESGSNNIGTSESEETGDRAPFSQGQRPPAPRAPVFSRTSSTGSADSDPHFIVHMKGLDRAVCFDVMGKPGDIYRLVKDPESGITVNADIVIDKEPKETGEKLKTYLGHIALLRWNTQVDITTTSIIFNGVAFHWRTEQLITKNDVQILIYGNGKDILVMLGMDITVRIMRHRPSRHNHRKTDYLGFYIDDGRGFSTNTGGLLGQFLHKTVTTEPMKPHNHRERIRIHGGSKTDPVVAASLGKRLDMETDSEVTCWMVQRNGQGIIDGVYTDYLIKGLHDP